MLRKRKEFIVLMVVLALVMVTVIISAAPVTIDTFNDGNGAGGQATVCDDPAIDGCFGGLFSRDSATDVTVLGGERDLLVTQTSGTGNVWIYVNQGGSQRLAYASDPGTRGTGQIVWDGNDNDALAINTTGLGVVDLTDGGLNNGIQLIVYSTDGNFNLTIRLINGATESNYTLVLATAVSAPGQSFFIPFTSFTGTLVSPTDVEAVVFDIAQQADAVDLEMDLFEATANTDFGDLPALYNSTLNVDNGARHTVGALYLGAIIDRESDGFESANADGDNNQDLNDEEGVVRQPGVGGSGGNGGWTNGTVASGNGGRFDITITGGSGVPQVFMDFGDGGGNLSGTLTAVTLRDNTGTPLGMPLAAGLHQVYFDIPGGTFAVNGQPIAARVRLSSAGGLTATGLAPDGEVEDYIYTFGPTAVTLQNASASGSSVMPFVLGAFGLIVVSTGLVINRKRKTVK
jgi:hypothetical protein